MGWFGKEVGDAATGVMKGAGGLFKDLRTAITGEIPAEQRGEIEKQLIELEGVVTKGQNEINQVEAASHSLFIAGWRPAVGWVCAIAVAIHFIINPIVYLIWNISGLTIDMTTLMSLLTTLLGFGGFRTYEKLKGINKRH